MSSKMVAKDKKVLMDCVNEVIFSEHLSMMKKYFKADGDGYRILYNAYKLWVYFRRESDFLEKFIKRNIDSYGK